MSKACLTGGWPCSAISTISELDVVEHGYLFENSEASHKTWSLLFGDAMPKIDLLFSQDKLKSFGGFSRAIEGVNRSRLSNSDLITVLGQEELPIITLILN